MGPVRRGGLSGPTLAQFAAETFMRPVVARVECRDPSRTLPSVHHGRRINQVSSGGFVLVRRFSPWCCALISVSLLFVLQSSQGQAVHSPLPINSPLRDKNFYLLALLDQDSRDRSALVADSNLAGIGAERQHYLTTATIRCKGNATCLLKSFVWTNEEIETTSAALAELYAASESLRALVDGPLRSSGAYQAYSNQTGKELLTGAWRVCAYGMNEIITVYGEGQPPRYPLIDSISFDTNSAQFQLQISELVARISGGDSGSAPFFEPALNVSLDLLKLNHRDEAARSEPMESGANQATVRHISDTDWQKYPYTVIVVPGEGPSDPDVPLDPIGRKRVELAAEAYRAGKAPLLLVSGGYVHPSQTRFAEALEMKKALINDLKVPESAILVDPHARHTTTNLRNASREMYRYNVPVDKPALVISDPDQIAYIASQGFADRCLKELGYMPFRMVSRPSDTSIVFLPEAESLEQDPIDPLDP
jgi:hypothetical protein